MADMINGLLGNIRDPRVSQGLLALGSQMMTAGSQGAPMGAAVGQGYQAYQQAYRSADEYAREQKVRELREKAVSQITDADLQLLAQIDPSGHTLAQVLASRMRSQAGEGTPSNVKEWEYFNRLPPDQQQQYLGMKRAAQYQDLGGYVAPVDPRTGMLNTGAATPKTLAPQDLPAVRGAQAQASAEGTAAGATAAKAPQYESFKVAAANMAQSIDTTPTGGPMGSVGHLSRVTDYQKVRQFDNRKEQLSTELRAIFRIPGEGTLSDREQAQYGLQLPDVRNDPEINRQIVNELDARIQARIGAPPASQRRKRYNPQTGKIEEY